MPDWAQDLAAIATVTAAAVWLIVRWFRIGKPHATQPGCARCEHNPIAQPEPQRGVRSSQLRVLR